MTEQQKDIQLNMYFKKYTDYDFPDIEHHQRFHIVVLVGDMLMACCFQR